jgi:hypothetical protein
VTTIGDEAFKGCSGLTSVAIPINVTSIGYATFAGCKGLTSVAIPINVTSIGDYAFQSCSGLTSVTIPMSVSNIGNCAFLGCSGLTSITIPISVTNIGDNAFLLCSGLTSVEVEWKTPLSISYGTFDGVYKNATLYVPVGCKAAYNEAEPWKNFKHIVEPSPAIAFADANVKALCLANWDIDGDGELSESEAAEVTSIGGVFKENASIKFFTELKYFSGLTTIESNAFFNCSSLALLTIPDGVTSMGNAVFRNCSGLTSIDIPSNVASIGNFVFFGCTGLTNATISEGVTSMGNSVFYGCKSLASITIPESVTSLGDMAFNNCSSLASVTSYIKEPTDIDPYVFNGISATAKLYVPKGTREKYMAWENWIKNFSSVLEIGSPEPLRGDVNGDLTVDVADIASVIDVMASGTVTAAADVNEDGVVDVADIAAVIDIMAANAR